MTPLLRSDYYQHFPLPLRFEMLDLSHGRRCELLEPFVFVDGITTIAVDKGFTTDFNSVPRFLWRWFPPWDYPAAGVVHDFLYRYPRGLTRQQCDEKHRRILEVFGARPSFRGAVYLGLRAGGWVPWDNYRLSESIGNTITTAS